MSPISSLNGKQLSQVYTKLAAFPRLENQTLELGSLSVGRGPGHKER